MLWAAILMICTAHYLRTLRWELFVKTYEKPDRRKLIQSLAIGYFINFFVSFKSGDLARAWIAGRNRLLLFIPMYNCEKQIVRVLAQLDKEVMKYISQIIIVDNKSIDAGEQAAVEYCRRHGGLRVKILRNDENYGLGGSHKVASQYAASHGYDYVITFHGDDQGRIADFIPLIKSKRYRKYDCCLGARFMKGSELIGYNRIRILGNFVFNLIFSIVVHKPVKDLGSGLNMYKVSTLKSGYYMQYPDTLYFNDLMILASCHYNHKMLFYPISWREEDQVSNNKLWSFSVSLLRMLWNYKKKQRRVP